MEARPSTARDERQALVQTVLGEADRLQDSAIWALITTRNHELACAYSAYQECARSAANRASGTATVSLGLIGPDIPEANDDA